MQRVTRLLAVLIAWTIVVWAGRVRNVLADDDLATKYLEGEPLSTEEIVRGLPEDIAEYGKVGPDDVRVITNMTTEIDLGAVEAA